jgi:hypothetical protein
MHTLGEREIAPASLVGSEVRRPMLGPVFAGAIGLGVCVTAALVDPTGGPVLCPFRAATGLYCPGCGATRMMHRLMVGDPFGALHMNPLAFVFLPLMAWWSYAGLTAMLGGPRWPTPRFTARQTSALAIVVVAFWVLRNIPMSPFTLLAPG